MIANLYHFFRLLFKLFKWFLSRQPGAVFIVDTHNKKISDFYRQPTSVEQVRTGVWASTTDAANRGVIEIRDQEGI